MKVKTLRRANSKLEMIDQRVLLLHLNIYKEINDYFYRMHAQTEDHDELVSMTMRNFWQFHDNFVDKRM
jgi:hypothetical protein